MLCARHPLHGLPSRSRANASAAGLSRGSRRSNRHVPLPRPQRQRSRCLRRGHGQAPPDAERRSGRMERDHRAACSGLLRLHDHRRWCGHVRSFQSRYQAQLPRQVQRIARPWAGVPFMGDWRGASRRNSSSFLQVRSGGRRPGLFRLHAARLRRARKANLSGPLSVARIQ